ncbi:MAG: methylenetetrahydrofolate reductase [NAD(P)H] [Elusimicrobia bacterium CG1_02_63_36]|nr:MAG: methylenetetrahydrofolate reductase [NAD(P)H] [Elusimicrobia bacterium CG1_02_63_36]PIP83721.1 MAG: methylenetetrahydrofolate reductase [NAD(P)H] [Elusimicrobia bacterium CG22_combo_CG10-13_8_21_14_all_63_91]PJA13638.1 MAG: methylenetetrahydrofolate reductase [NAD(P)H] [Elusimicrobia bacterium CG_4_10_14_0_2_um_filter_63_34]PJB26235.1 MAG: methylenetetrahydrofolate reductase [NAD(P)H] [Elusimicrobia bacterium CG_4_9_14_3_um_filter_62_55]
MRIPSLYGRGTPVFSFEFFLPKAPSDMDRFRKTVVALKALAPDFVSLTYGAGGSARTQTIETAEMIKREIGIETACHLTCVAHTKAEIDEILDRIERSGIENIVALRGDMPQDREPIPAARRELPFAADLVRRIRVRGGFAMGVAGYPETHPEAVSPEADLARLKEKVDAGGEWVITQLFFDNAVYFDFVDRARKIGIQCPIVPGIMPVASIKQTKRFTEMCGTSLPKELRDGLDAVADDPEGITRFGIDYATRQCRGLLAGGAPGVHFYTLNKSRATATILAKLRDS